MIGSPVSAQKSEQIKNIAYDKKAYGHPDGWSFERIVENVRLLVEAGHDPIGIIIDRARQKKLEVFITFRMNEVHDVDQPDSLLLSTFWKEHPDWRVGGDGWNGQALNFDIPEVRKRRLEELVECCQRYDIDGLELDFQRFPSYFPPGKGPEKIPVMNTFVQSVREITQSMGQNRGRPLLLVARVPNSLAHCQEIGLDPIAWAKQGLVDFLTVSEFLFTREDSTIAEFKRQINTIPIYGDIQIEFPPQKNGRPLPLTAADYRRVAQSHLEQGADGILLFNFFTSREYGREPLFEVLNQIGSLETIKAADK